MGPYAICVQLTQHTARNLGGRIDGDRLYSCYITLPPALIYYYCTLPFMDAKH